MYYTATFDDPECLDNRQVGGKATGLAQMTLAGLPVAPGFALKASAYRAFLASSGIEQHLDAVLASTDLSNPDDVRRVATSLSTPLANASLPAEVCDAVRTAYATLCARLGLSSVAVAVRSSATAEDSVGASFAGEFETWVDVSGIESVLEHVRLCYISVFAERVLLYLGKQSIKPGAIEMAIVVQKMVRARAAGVMFTISPVTGDRSKIVIEASWGLGLAVVGGEVTPDRFLIDKVGLHVSEKVVGDKAIEYRRGDVPTLVPDDRRYRLCLDDAEAVAIAKLGKALERVRGGAQDIEFAIDEELPAESALVLLQCRPETIWSSARRQPVFDTSKGVTSWVTGTVGGGRVARASESTKGV